MRARSGQGGRGGQALTKWSDGCVQTERTGRTSSRADSRADGGGKDANSGADGQTGPTRHGHADGRTRCGWGPTKARTGGSWHGRAEEARTYGPRGRAGRGGLGQTRRTGARTAGRSDRRTGVLAVRRSGGLADGQTGGRASGPGFRRPHSTRPTSLLGAQSACLVRARARRVPGSAVGSSTTPRQTPVLSAQTRLPRLSASVLGAEKGILLFSKNGFT